jgi:hypothetical protein
VMVNIDWADKDLCQCSISVTVSVRAFPNRTNYRGRPTVNVGCGLHYPSGWGKGENQKPVSAYSQ